MASACMNTLLHHSSKKQIAASLLRLRGHAKGNWTTRSLHTLMTSSTVTSTPSVNHHNNRLSSSNGASVRQFATANAGEGGMNDEYGEMTADGESYVHEGEFQLAYGGKLMDPELRYMTYGTLNEARDNVLVVCHALTGNASLHSWWGSLLGDNLAFDTSKYFIVCANILGSCYGSTNPLSINPETGEIYGIDFPDIAVKDTVKIQLEMLKEHLNIRSVKCVIGGSFGGMQTLEYAVQNSDNFIRSIIPIGCGAQHTAWQIGISETQRQAIYADPEWKAGNHMQAQTGLSVARQIGMVSYRTAKGYQSKFGRRLSSDSIDSWEVRSYLEYQGVKFLSRFDPVTYVKLTQQMDSHDVRDKLESGAVQIPTLVLGIDSDILYPVHEQEEVQQLIGDDFSQLSIIKSEAGHDGFLLEQDQVNKYITDFLTGV